MKVLGVALLSLVALATGGCSVLFLFASLFDARPAESLSFVGVPALIGLGTAGLCLLAIRAIVRSKSPGPSQPNPGDPPKGHW